MLDAPSPVCTTSPTVVLSPTLGVVSPSSVWCHLSQKCADTWACHLKGTTRAFPPYRDPRSEHLCMIPPRDKSSGKRKEPQYSHYRSEVRVRLSRKGPHRDTSCTKTLLDDQSYTLHAFDNSGVTLLKVQHMFDSRGPARRTPFLHTLNILRINYFTGRD